MTRRPYRPNGSAPSTMASTSQLRPVWTGPAAKADTAQPAARPTSRTASNHVMTSICTGWPATWQASVRRCCRYGSRGRPLVVTRHESSGRHLQRRHWLRQIEQLDPAIDYHGIYRITVAYEFLYQVDTRGRAGNPLRATPEQHPQFIRRATRSRRSDPPEPTGVPCWLTVSGGKSAGSAGRQQPRSRQPPGA